MAATKMGRPTKAVKRTQIIRVRLTTLEYDRLQYELSLTKQTFSEFIRERISDIIS